MPENLKLFTICYKPEQITNIQPGFEVWDNLANESPELCEYPNFRRLFDSPLTKDVRFWGAFSDKFTAKTGLSGIDFAAWINNQLPAPDFLLPKSNPKHKDTDWADLRPICYFINPVPIVESLFPSTIYHGNNCHPGLANIMSETLTKMGYKIDFNTLYMDTSTFSLCNYFVGNRVFWHQYLEFVDEFIDTIKKDPANNQMMFHDSASYGRNAALPFYPFVVERLLSICFSLAKQGQWKDATLRVVGYQYDYQQFLEKTKLPPEMCKKLRGLSDIKHAAISGEQEGLMETWATFRNEIAQANPYLFQIE